MQGSKAFKATGQAFVSSQLSISVMEFLVIQTELDKDLPESLNLAIRSQKIG